MELPAAQTCTTRTDHSASTTMRTARRRTTTRRTAAGMCSPVRATPASACTTRGMAQPRRQSSQRTMRSHPSTEVLLASRKLSCRNAKPKRRQKRGSDERLIRLAQEFPNDAGPALHIGVVLRENELGVWQNLVQSLRCGDRMSGVAGPGQDQHRHPKLGEYRSIGQVGCRRPAKYEW